MAPARRPESDKTKRLKQYGALNPHPEKVTNELFVDSTLDFFDPHDLVQVKYEMLRSVDKEARSVTAASKDFGFSRPAYYQAQSQFKEAGLTGLIRARPGPKSAHKLTTEIVDFIEEEVEKSGRIRARKLALLVRERFGIKIHPRSIERALERKGKKSKPAKFGESPDRR